MYNGCMKRLGRGIPRWAWLLLTWIALGLAVAGALLPVLPTTPFLLVALWAGSRSSPRLRYRLFRHPRYGPALRAWHRHRAIPAKAKVLAFVLMTISATTLWWSGVKPLIFYSVLGLFVAVSIFLLSRPSRMEDDGTRRRNDNRRSDCRCT